MDDITKLVENVKDIATDAGKPYWADRLVVIAYWVCDDYRSAGPMGKKRYDLINLSIDAEEVD